MRNQSRAQSPRYFRTTMARKSTASGEAGWQHASLSLLQYRPWARWLPSVLFFNNTLFVKVPYHKLVASELLRLANGKATAHFRELKHIVGKKITNVKLYRLVAVCFRD